jgi:hypothetical protein
MNNSQIIIIINNYSFIWERQQQIRITSMMKLRADQVREILTYYSVKNILSSRIYLKSYD